MNTCQRQNHFMSTQCISCRRNNFMSPNIDSCRRENRFMTPIKFHVAKIELMSEPKSFHVTEMHFMLPKLFHVAKRHFKACRRKQHFMSPKMISCRRESRLSGWIFSETGIVDATQRRLQSAVLSNACSDAC